MEFLNLEMGQGGRMQYVPTGDPAYNLRFKPFIFACCPLRKFQGCDRRLALRILGCLSKASSQNSACLTEQTGPEGEMFVGAAFFGLPFLAVKKGNWGLGQRPVPNCIQ